MKITYLGHASFVIEIDGVKFLTDPFLKNNPHYFEKLWDLAQQPDYILVTHGHGDHIGDTVEIAADGKATVISNFEICNWLAAQNVQNCIDMNVGGAIPLNEGIEVVMTPAVHSSSIETETGNVYAGLACGYIIRKGNKSVYHSGDTCLFGDMKLINDLYRPAVGLLPVGGRFTMNINDAAFACNNFFSFQAIIPMHYNTFPPVAANPKEIENLLKNTAVCALEPGSSVEM